MKAIRIRAMAVGLGLGGALLTSGVAKANNWGAGIPGSGGSDVRCTINDHDSQCTGNNATWRVMITSIGFNAKLEAAIKSSVANDSDDSSSNNTDIDAAMTSDFNTADVWVIEQNGPDPEEWGWADCHPSSDFGGGQGLRKWCKPHVIHMNTDHESDWNNDNHLEYRRWLACHELGHTLGLRHTNGLHSPAATSCMYTGAQTIAFPVNPASWDRAHLRHCYPNEGDLEDTGCRD
jgi:hypothetical protein